MINRRDVVILKIPFPDIDSTLAIQSHMYICRSAQEHTHRFVKCQTYKPYMLIAEPMHHFWDELPDSSRNPFQRKTRIDCDKEFVTCQLCYDARLKTTVRPDVCEDVIIHVEDELFCDGYDTHTLPEDEIRLLNPRVTPV